MLHPSPNFLQSLASVTNHDAKLEILKFIKEADMGLNNLSPEFNPRPFSSAPTEKRKILDLSGGYRLVFEMTKSGAWPLYVE